MIGVDKKRFVYILMFLVGAVGFFHFSGRSIVVDYDGGLTGQDMAATINQEILPTDTDDDTYPKSSLGSIDCPAENRRPYAVMLSEDTEARPLSGIGLADIVIEMPVVTGSITRMMALFACSSSVEIGSIRSARHDFIYLAQGYDAILVHWGGEKLAQEELAEGIIDNLDALPNYFGTFYRKKAIPAPHNGFTDMERMVSGAEGSGYRLTSRFAGYKFLENRQLITDNQQLTFKILEIGYRYPYNVEYRYDPSTNGYLRWRGGLKEIDKLTDEQLVARNVVIMVAASRQIGGGYNDVDVVGGGEAVVYRNGEEVEGVWRKRNNEDALRFFDGNGEEIEFVPGTIWIEIVEPTTEVIYE